MTGPIHHRVAKRWVRTAQVAMLVGAVGVIPVLLFGMPDSAPRSVPDLKPVEPAPAPADKTPRTVGVDSAGVGARFELVSNTPKPKPVVDEAPDQAAAPTAAPPAIKYLGAIIEPAARAALLVIDGKQRMLWVGDKSGAIELVAVEREHVSIKEHGVERRVDLAPRTGPIVSMASGAPMNSGAMQPPNENPASSPDQLELRAREQVERIRARSEGRISPR